MLGEFRLVITGLIMCVVVSGDNINLRPRQQINAESLGHVFQGNSTTPDFFKLLERDGDSLLVGARDAVYNLSLPTLAVQQALRWESSEKDRSECRIKGKSQDDCHNYIRVLVKQSGDRALVCGTNAFSPLCRIYIIQNGGYMGQKELDGRGISPYDPRHNSTATYLEDGAVEEIYAGTVADLAGNDPLIYRKPLSDTGSVEIRTRRYDLKCLNEPDFVSSFADSNHVYFWFREVAEEFRNHGRAVYGRVARVCRRDIGGPQSQEAWASSWTTFLKARLNCSLPGDIPFQFDQLQATTSPVRTSDGSELVYAVLSTPPNAVQMSAVCAFRMQDVRNIFDSGAFKAQATTDSLWLPIQDTAVPKPRPGSCSLDSTGLGADVVNFVHRNSLMNEAVPNHFSEPLFIDNSLRSQLTQIAVHPQVQAVSGRRYDVLFLGTSDGRVLKSVSAQKDGVSSVLVESVRVFQVPEPVINLMLHLPTTALGNDWRRREGALVVVTENQVRSLPLHYCVNKSSCSACLSLRDPYCAWDLEKSVCVGRTDGYWLDGEYVQSVESGRSEKCPEGAVDPELYAINELYPEQVVVASPAIYTSGSMAIAVLVTLALASTLGFLAGYRLRLRQTPDSASSTTSASDYDSHSMARSRLTHHDGTGKLHQLDLYGSPVANGKLVDHQFSLVMTHPDGTSTIGRTPKPEKNLLTLNNGTLPKDYKVKKVYV